MPFSGTVLAHAVMSTLRISVPTVLESLTAKGDAATHDARLASWSKSLLEHVGVRLEIEGLEHVARDEAFVVMSNHESVYDIPIIYQAIPKRIRMVAKQELFKVPVWGEAMRRAGFVPIDRKNRRDAIQSLRHAKAAIDGGTSIWIAPEGTRSRSGELGEFKSGGFHLAIDTGARILPVSLRGARAILAAETYGVARGVCVYVKVSAPIDPREYGRARRRELSDAVRRVIAGGLAEGSAASEIETTQQQPHVRDAASLPS